MSQHSNLTQHPMHFLADAEPLERHGHSDSGQDIPDSDVLDAAISRVLARQQQQDSQRTNGAHRPLDLSAAAKMIYDARRKIDAVFGLAGFSVSPAWDIMLDLFAAHADNRAISVSSACIGAACPPTTALRWIGVLEQQGLVARTNDATDARRTFLTLTSAGVSLTDQAIRGSIPASWASPKESRSLGSY